MGYQPCDLAIWAGLEDDFGAADIGDHIAQAGSDGKITCTSPTNCTTEYFLWYEFFTKGGSNNQATICTGFSFNPGNGVQAIVTSQGKTGGTPTLYNVSVINTSTGVGCGATSVSFAMSNPAIAAFINERAQYNPLSYATLAKFSSDTITGYMYYDGALMGISTPQTNGWYNQVRMVNTVVNIDYATVSGNAITLTYIRSTNTGT